MDKFTLDELEVICDLFHAQIVECGPVAKLAFKRNEISEGEFKWRQNHGIFLQDLKNKLIKNLPRK